MDNGTITLSYSDAATLLRLAAREHERKRKRGKPAKANPAAWAMEVSGEKMLLERLFAEATKRLA